MPAFPVNRGRPRFPRARLAPALCVGAILAVGCGPPAPVSLGSRRSIENVFSQDWPARKSVLDAYDRGGLQAAVESYQLARRQEPAVPLYPLSPERLSPASLRSRADEIISDGFEWYGRRFPLKTPVAWASDPYHDRLWRFYLNGWEPLNGILAAHAATGDSAYLQFAIGIACDWIRQNPVGARRNPFAWYDMAVGKRALLLAHLVDAAARDPSTRPEAMSTLVAGASVHGRQLADPRNFNDLTNHGIYQAAGLLALGRSLPELRGAEQWGKTGAERLRLMFEKSFSSEGVHLEHSPGYHLAMVRLLEALTGAGLTDDPPLLALRDRAERALAWMIAPDGTLPLIGDTGPNVVRPASLGLPDATVAPELAYAVTQGTAGTPPKQLFRVFPESGYAVFRSGWPASEERWRQASYLMLTGAFHSRTHKQADDLSFVWYDAGRWLLVDAGRYGYYYGDPKFVYVESTRAHNTVEVDRQDSSRRSPETFGSALTDWGEQSGAFFVSASIRRRWPALRQSRTLVFNPGKWVVVVDEFDGLASHSYQQWLHFARDLALRADANVASVNLGDGRSLHIVPLIAPPATTVEAVRGQTEPVMQGWYSSGHRTLDPNWALGYRAEGRTAVFATLLCLSTSMPEVDFSRTTVTSGQISLRWRADDGSEGFTLRRSAQPARLEVVPSTPPRTP